jgi:hypothetical protein
MLKEYKKVAGVEKKAKKRVKLKKNKIRIKKIHFNRFCTR